MKTKFVILAACLTLIVSIMAFPAFAANAHTDSVMKWTNPSTSKEYQLNVYWSSSIRSAPYYIVFDDGIKVLIDEDDTSGSPTLAIRSSNGSRVQEFKTPEYTTLENKSFYSFDLGSSSIVGLDCSNLYSFRDSIDYTQSNVYYLENASDDWSDAISLQDVEEPIDPFTAFIQAIGVIVTAFIGFVSTVALTVTGNPILLLFTIISLIGLGIGLFVRLKNVGR